MGRASSRRPGCPGSAPFRNLGVCAVEPHRGLTPTRVRWREARAQRAAVRNGWLAGLPAKLDWFSQFGSWAPASAGVILVVFRNPAHGRARAAWSAPRPCSRRSRRAWRVGKFGHRVGCIRTGPLLPARRFRPRHGGCVRGKEVGATWPAGSGCVPRQARLLVRRSPPSPGTSAQHRHPGPAVMTAIALTCGGAPAD